MNKNIGIEVTKINEQKHLDIYLMESCLLTNTLMKEIKTAQNSIVVIERLYHYLPIRVIPDF